jgi:hypothetical protein
MGEAPDMFIGDAEMRKLHSPGELFPGYQEEVSSSCICRQMPAQIHDRHFTPRFVLYLKLIFRRAIIGPIEIRPLPMMA